MATIWFSVVGGMCADGGDGVGALDAAPARLLCSSERKAEEEKAGKGMTCGLDMAMSLDRRHSHFVTARARAWASLLWASWLAWPRVRSGKGVHEQLRRWVAARA
jgi:hypothetical protein